jgi:hypothetical protein
MDKRQRDNDTEGTKQEWPRTHVSMRELRRRIAWENETMPTPRALLSRAWSLDAIQRLDEKQARPRQKTRERLQTLDTPSTKNICANMTKLGVRLEVTEKLLNHISGSLGGIVAIYHRYDFQSEMGDAIERWEKRLVQIVGQ